MDRGWWIALTVAGVVLLGGMAAAGVADRDLPGRLVVEGGPVSVLTEVAWLLAAALAVVAAAGSRRARGWIRWALVAGLATLAWGEESEWSPDLTHGRVVGDFHNWASHYVLHQFGAPLMGAAALAAVVLVLAALAVWRAARARRGFEGPVGRREVRIGPHLAVGLGLLGLAVLLDLWAEAGWAYVAGFWPLEESLELLGAIAILGAPLRVVRAAR